MFGMFGEDTKNRASILQDTKNRASMFGVFGLTVAFISINTMSS